LITSGLGKPPTGTFTQISMGFGEHGCALSTDNDIHCWGNKSSGGAWPNIWPGKYVEVSAGGLHTCALNTTGGIVCYGPYDVITKDKPTTTGKFVSIHAGYAHTCVQADGNGGAKKVHCWGTDNVSTNIDWAWPLDSGKGYSCGEYGHDMTCFGTPSPDYGQTEPPADLKKIAPPFDGDLYYRNRLSLAHYYACAVNGGNQVVCWGLNKGYSNAPDKAVKAKAISVMQNGNMTAGCIIKWDTDQLMCWNRFNKSLLLKP